MRTEKHGSWTVCAGEPGSSQIWIHDDGRVVIKGGPRHEDQRGKRTIDQELSALIEGAISGRFQPDREDDRWDAERLGIQILSAFKASRGDAEALLRDLGLLNDRLREDQKEHPEHVQIRAAIGRLAKEHQGPPTKVEVFQEIHRHEPSSTTTDSNYLTLSRRLKTLGFTWLPTR